jgi:dual specificity phosphatase 12
MQDHGQLSSPSPAVAYSPVVPSPPSFTAPSRASLDDERNENEETKPPVDEAVVDEAEDLGRKLSESLTLAESKRNVGSSMTETETSEELSNEKEMPLHEVSSATTQTTSSPTPHPVTNPNRPPVPRPVRNTSGLAHPSDLSAQLYNNPAVAALRPSISVIPPSPSSPSYRPSPNLSPVLTSPILVNAKCSGYFVEPVSPIVASCALLSLLLVGTQLKWMEPFLEKGELSGKIVCPNKKCNAKLGNYDWAGLCCGCKEWVVPVSCLPSVSFVITDSTNLGLLHTSFESRRDSLT